MNNSCCEDKDTHEKCSQLSVDCLSTPDKIENISSFFSEFVRQEDLYTDRTNVRRDNEGKIGRSQKKIGGNLRRFQFFHTLTDKSEIALNAAKKHNLELQKFWLKSALLLLAIKVNMLKTFN